MEEVWRPIAGYEGCYEVSSEGRVRSLPRTARNTTRSTRPIPGQVLAPFLRPRSGYATVRLAKGGKKVSHYVHRLVATAFHGPCPQGMETCHHDGNSGNNRAENLYWGTRQENIADKTRHGTVLRGQSHGMAKLTEEQARAILADTRPAKIVAAEYGVSPSMVGMIRSGRNWTHLHG